MNEIRRVVRARSRGRWSHRRLRGLDTLLTVACLAGVMVLLLMVVVGDDRYAAPAFSVAICLIAKVNLRVKRLEAILQEHQESGTNPAEQMSDQAGGRTE